MGTRGPDLHPFQTAVTAQVVGKLSRTWDLPGQTLGARPVSPGLRPQEGGRERGRDLRLWPEEVCWRRGRGHQGGGADAPSLVRSHHLLLGPRHEGGMDEDGLHCVNCDTGSNQCG